MSCFADALRGIGASNSPEESRNAEGRGCAVFEKHDAKKGHIFSPAKDEETSHNYCALPPPSAKKKARPTTPAKREGGASNIYRGFLPRKKRRSKLSQLTRLSPAKREETTSRDYRGVLPRNAMKARTTTAASSRGTRRKGLPQLPRLSPAKREGETSHNSRGFFP